MAIEVRDIDEQALTLRSQSKGFGKIAEALGLGRPSDANAAFNRALRRRPPEERASIGPRKTAGSIDSPVPSRPTPAGLRRTSTSGCVPSNVSALD
jgi:hypothetical protein